MSASLRWRKQRLGADQRALLESVVRDLNQELGVDFHLIKHPFGKIIACAVGDLFLCHIGDGGRPAEIWTVAVTGDRCQSVLLPARHESDFARCCDLLDYRTEAQRDHFRQFLLPQLDRTTPAPATRAV